MLFYPHPILSEAIDFIYSWESLFYHPSLLAHSKLLRGLISLLPFKILSNHPLLGWLRLLPCNMLLYPSSFLNLGIEFSVFQNFFYHPALLCHSMLLGKCHATFIHSFGKGFIFHIFSFFSSILPSSPIPNFRNMPFVLKGLIFLYFLNSFFYYPLLLPHSMLLRGGGCYVSNYVSFTYFSSLLCPSIL